MERVNLNISADARTQLRGLAADLGLREAELARQLLMEALERARRERFFERVEASQTPQRQQRQLELVGAMERVSGQAG